VLWFPGIFVDYISFLYWSDTAFVVWPNFVNSCQFLLKTIVWAFRKSTGKVKYLFPSLRKSQLKFSAFCKISRKITKFVKHSLRLWGHQWCCGAQKCLPMMSIVSLNSLEFTSQIFVVRVKIQSWTKIVKNEKLAQILLLLRFMGTFKFMYLHCYRLKVNKKLTWFCSSRKKTCSRNFMLNR
jgi:hypothetical protein